jgi:hypothetical protein
LPEGIYLLAATVADPDECEPTREVLRSLLPGKARRLHWHTEGGRRRRLIAAALAERPVRHTVVIGAPLDARKPERARRLCLERLLFELAALDVSQVWLESRTDRLNRADRTMAAALHSQGLIPKTFHVGFAAPTAEPMLWLPDVVAGAVGAHRCGGDDEPWQALRATIREIDLRLS